MSVSADQQAGRYLKQFKMSSGLTVVVAEGELEPRSIGSYSIRIYGVNLEFPTDDFLCGLIRPRDGSVERVIIQDINGDQKEEIVVVVRSAGTGGYLSAEAFDFRENQLKRVAGVEGLEKNEDPVAALAKKL
jgi:hypothetical protein